MCQDVKLIFNFSCQHVSEACQLHEPKICHLTLVSEERDNVVYWKTNRKIKNDLQFRSMASFGDPHYLSRTSPHSIHCAWNCRIWNFEFRKTLLPRKNLWNFVSCRGLDSWWKQSHCFTMLLYSQSHSGCHFRMLFQSSKLKARTSLFTETWQKRRSSFELLKMSPQVGLAVLRMK